MGEVSSLLVIWSVTAFVVEVPSGALADAVSRRALLCVGSPLCASGFAVWSTFSSYPAFAAGMTLWAPVPERIAQASTVFTENGPDLDALTADMSLGQRARC